MSLSNRNYSTLSTMNVPNLKEFNKIKICIDFIPDMQCKVHMQYSTIKQVACRTILSKDGQKWFSPWIIMKDKFNGDVLVNECNSFLGITLPKIFHLSLYGTFFKVQTKNYPAYVGYFDNFFKASKAYQNFKKKIKEELKFERVLDELIEKQIEEFKIRKQK